MNKIKIKPSHKGKFTAYKKRTGKTTEEALHSKDSKVRKMANFAKNAKKWKKEDGGEITKDMKKFGGFIPKAQDGVTINQPKNNTITSNEYSQLFNDYTLQSQDPSMEDNIYPSNKNLNLNIPQGFNFGNSYKQYNQVNNTKAGSQTNNLQLNNSQPVNLQRQGYDWNYNSNQNYGNQNNSQSYQIGDNQTTNGQLLNPNKQIVDPNIYSKSNKTNNFQNSNGFNFGDTSGHGNNYWGQFADSSWKATDALAHAIPDTLGTIKQNSFNTINEANNRKRIQNPFQTLSPNTGYNMGQSRAFGGKIDDYKSDRIGGNVEIEGGGGQREGEGVQLPNGLIDNVTGAKHGFEGGEPMNLPEGTKIFSERLKHPEEKKAFSKLAKKYDTTEEKEIIDNPTSDKIQKDTANYSMELKNKMADELFQQQESYKLGGQYGKKIANKTKKEYQKMQPQQSPQMQDDTPPMAMNGSVIDMSLHSYPNRLGFWNGVLPGIEAHSSAFGGTIIDGDYEIMERKDLGGFMRRKIK